MRISRKFTSGLFAAIVLCGSGMLSTTTLTSCKESIDDSAFKISSKYKLIELLEADTTQYSGIIKLFSEVKLGLNENASTLSSVLSSRGNYTLFVPTNEALNTFIHNELELNSIDELTPEQKKIIAYNCIIDNGSQSAYELSDFPANGTSFGIATLDDRRLTSVQKADGNYYLNSEAKVLKSNIEASNGMMHVIDHVIYPSVESVPEIIAAAPNLRIMGQLLKATGWAEKLRTRTDLEDAYVTQHADRIGSSEFFEGEGSKYPFMDKRRIRYTAFVETDDVLHNEWGVPMPIYDEKTDQITNWDEILNVIKQKCAQALPAEQGEAQSDDITNEDNAVNKYVAYHLINGGMPVNGMVAHYNEYGYNHGSDTKNPQTNNLSVNVWDYYTTVGKHRALIKVTQVAKGEHEFYVNRVSKYDNGFTGTYAELSHTDNAITNGVPNGLNLQINLKNEVENADGSKTTYTNNALNGYYYTVNHIMINSAATQQALGSERIRMDVTTMLPEILSNDLRISGTWTYFPQGYFDNITNEGSSTRIFYLNTKATGAAGWKDYQGDELLITGAYHFVLKLPPVPKSGYYELRMSCANNRNRSMVQCYLDEDDPFPPTPTGLPIDQREDANYHWPKGLWVNDQDNSYDETACREADQNLRNQGFLKGPQYICVDGTQGKTTVRNHVGAQGWGPSLRYILIRRYFDKDKTYYIRFKNALTELNTQFFLDYFEFCPSDVYASPNGEDIW